MNLSMLIPGEKSMVLQGISNRKVPIPFMSLSDNSPNTLQIPIPIYTFTIFNIKIVVQNA